MNRKRVIEVSTLTITVMAALLVTLTVLVSAQNHEREKGEPPLPLYNPYPPGILPADLQSEIARVLREIDVIEGRAIQRWHSLPLPTRLPQRAGE